MDPTAIPVVHSFLFSEDHSTFEVDAIYRLVIEQVLIISSDVVVEIRVGSLLPHTFAYRAAGIVPGTSKRFRSYSTPSVPDKALYATLVIDLAQSCCSLWHELSADQLIDRIGKGRVFSVTTVGLSEAHAKTLCEALRRSPTFIGACEVDCGNPWVRVMMIEYLLPFGRVADRAVSMIDEGPEGGVFTAWADGTAIEFAKTIRSLKIAVPNIPDSARGAVSRTMLQTRAAPTPGERVVRALIDKAPKEIPHFVLNATNDGVPTADIRKFVEYVLNDKHPTGKEKSTLFRRRLGFTRLHASYLSEQLIMGLADANVSTVGVNQYGAKYGADIPVRGINGHVMLVHTAWIIGPQGPPSLVTAYPLDARQPTPEEIARTTNIQFINETQPEVRWQTLYSMAETAGLAAVDRTIPTPVAVGGESDDARTKYYADGRCGYGFVEITEKHSAFVRWLRKRNLMSSGRYKLIHYSHGSQSFDRAKAYCNAFARVLRMNNVACRVECHLD